MVVILGWYIPDISVLPISQRIDKFLQPTVERWHSDMKRLSVEWNEATVYRGIFWGEMALSGRGSWRLFPFLSSVGPDRWHGHNALLKPTTLSNPSPENHLQQTALYYKYNVLYPRRNSSKSPPSVRLTIDSASRAPQW